MGAELNYTSYGYISAFHNSTSAGFSGLTTDALARPGGDGLVIKSISQGLLILDRDAQWQQFTNATSWTLQGLQYPSDSSAGDYLYISFSQSLNTPFDWTGGSYNPGAFTSGNRAWIVARYVASTFGPTSQPVAVLAFYTTTTNAQSLFSVNDAGKVFFWANTEQTVYVGQLTNGLTVTTPSASAVFSLVGLNSQNIRPFVTAGGVTGLTMHRTPAGVNQTYAYLDTAGGVTLAGVANALNTTDAQIMLSQGPSRCIDNALAIWNRNTTTGLVSLYSLASPWTTWTLLDSFTPTNAPDCYGRLGAHPGISFAETSSPYTIGGGFTATLPTGSFRSDIQKFYDLTGAVVDAAVTYQAVTPSGAAVPILICGAPDIGSGPGLCTIHRGLTATGAPVAASFVYNDVLNPAVLWSAQGPTQNTYFGFASRVVDAATIDPPLDWPVNLVQTGIYGPAIPRAGLTGVVRTQRGATITSATPVIEVTDNVGAVLASLTLTGFQAPILKNIPGTSEYVAATRAITTGVTFTWSGGTLSPPNGTSITFRFNESLTVLSAWMAGATGDVTDMVVDAAKIVTLNNVPSASVTRVDLSVNGVAGTTVWSTGGSVNGSVGNAAERPSGAVAISDTGITITMTNAGYKMDTANTGAFGSTYAHGVTGRVAYGVQFCQGKFYGIWVTNATETGGTAANWSYDLVVDELDTTSATPTGEVLRVDIDPTFLFGGRSIGSGQTGSPAYIVHPQINQVGDRLLLLYVMTKNDVKLWQGATDYVRMQFPGGFPSGGSMWAALIGLILNPTGASFVEGITRVNMTHANTTGHATETALQSMLLRWIGVGSQTNVANPTVSITVNASGAGTFWWDGGGAGAFSTAAATVAFLKTALVASGRWLVGRVGKG